MPRKAGETIIASVKKNRSEPRDDDFKVLGHGTAENGERYAKITIKNKDVLVRINNLLPGHGSEEFARLQNYGARLLKPAARTRLKDAIEEVLGKKALFSVATKVGWHKNGVFVFPDCVVPDDHSRVESYWEDNGADVISRYLVGGKASGALKLFALFRGNSRLIAGACLAFTGPISGILGLEHIGLQFVGERALGKTSTAAVISSIWGWDHSPTHFHGFGTTGTIRITG